MRDIKLKFVFKHPESGQIIISRSYMIDELVDQDNLHTTYDIQEECCVCGCKPEGETNVVECNCSDYYDKFELIDRIEWSGILDKRGVEIYEGDIVEYSKDNHEVMFGEHEGPGDYHDFDAYGFYLSKIKIPSFIHERSLLPFMSKDCVVIGNRFQNTELLNEKK